MRAATGGARGHGKEGSSSRSRVSHLHFRSSAHAAHLARGGLRFRRASYVVSPRRAASTPKRAPARACGGLHEGARPSTKAQKHDSLHGAGNRRHETRTAGTAARGRESMGSLWRARASDSSCRDRVNGVAAQRSAENLPLREEPRRGRRQGLILGFQQDVGESRSRARHEGKSGLRLGLPGSFRQDRDAVRDGPSGPPLKGGKALHRNPKEGISRSGSKASSSRKAFSVGSWSSRSAGRRRLKRHALVDEETTRDVRGKARRIARGRTPLRRSNEPAEASWDVVKRQAPRKGTTEHGCRRQDGEWQTSGRTQNGGFRKRDPPSRRKTRGVADATPHETPLANLCAEQRQESQPKPGNAART